MNKRTNYLLMVMLFAFFGMAAHAQTVTVGEVESGPGPVSVPVYMEDFTNVDAFQLAFTFNPQVLVGFNGIENRFVTGPNIIWAPQYNQNEGNVVVTFMDFNEVPYDIDGKVFDLKFVFAGGHDAHIEFDLANTDIMVNGGIMDNDNIDFVPGAVLTDPDLVAGTIFMDVVEDVVPDQAVHMPVAMDGDGFGAIEAIDLKIGFNPDQLIFEEVLINEDLDFDLVMAELQEDDLLRVMLTANEPLDLSDIHLLDISFTYAAISEAHVSFLPGTEITASAGPLAFDMVDGVFVPMAFDATLTIPHVEEYGSANVIVPVEVSGLDEDYPNVGNISLRIDFDDDLVEFAGFTSPYGEDLWSVGTGMPLILEMLVLDEDGVSLENDVNLIEMIFTFSEPGSTPIEFTDGTSMRTPLGVTLPFTPINGSASVSVTGSVYDALLDARENTDLVVTSPETNILHAVATYPDEFIVEDELDNDVLTLDWLVDAQFMSEQVIPEGTEIHITYGDHVFVYVIDQDVPAETKHFLSDMILAGNPDAIVRTPLLVHAGLEEVWHFEIVSPTSYETIVHMAIITDDADFSSSEDGVWNGFVLAHDMIEVDIESAVVEVATLAELRNMPDDGTIYHFTGEAVIVAMDGFRNRKFIQDETAAILIDDQPGVITTNYDLYDVIGDVLGHIDIWNNMVRFQPIENTADATENTPVDPVVFTLDEVTSDDQAKLIHFENVSFVDVGVGDTFANDTNYDITDGENFFELRVDFWNLQGITGEQIPLGPVNLTGVMVQFQDDFQIVPRMAEDIEELLYTITFDVTNNHGDPVLDAVISLNGVANDPGNYVFEDVIPGSYTYAIELFCYLDAAGMVTVTNEDLTEMVVLDNVTGDANGDGIVNVQDVMDIVDYFMGANPEPFCFVNADANADGEINVQDVMDTVDIFMGSRSVNKPEIILPVKDPSPSYDMQYKLFE